MGHQRARISANPPVEKRFDTIDRFAAEAGIALTESDVISVLIRLSRQRLIGHLPPALTSAEESFLDLHSGTRPNPQALQDARLATALTEFVDHNEALTTSEVADLLGVTTSRVRHRISEGTLYAFRSEGRGQERRLPAWQFEQGKEIPRLGEVLDALPDEFTALDVKSFFLNARVDHQTRDETFSVREWLIAGSDPSEVVALAHEQSYAL